MKVGYARVSTKDQTLDLQLDALNKEGCTKIYTETVSGAKADRPVLTKVMDAIPVAQLAPGPGGFSAGVNLRYDSAFSTLTTDAPNGPLRETYTTSTDGGWSYGFTFRLWASAIFDGSGYSAYLTTPNGQNHLLLLVSSLGADGVTVGPTLASMQTNYPGRPLYDVRFDGACIDIRYACNNVQGASGFQGTLIFATADSSYIRVESNTVTKTWAAFLPDGTSVSGTFPGVEPGIAEGGWKFD